MDREIRHAFGPGGPRCKCCRVSRHVTRAVRRAAKIRAIAEGRAELG